MTKKRNILITGGLGYIGSHTAVHLYQSGYNFVIVDNLSNSFLENLKFINELTDNNAIFHNVDIKSHYLDGIFKSYKITDVIHFAAHKSVNESLRDPMKYYTDNIGGTINLLNLMVENGVRNIVFSSSATVYGEPDSYPVSEKTPLKEPVTPYGRTKRVCEDIIIDYSKAFAINSVLLRYFNPIGGHPSGKLFENPKKGPENLMPYLMAVLRDEFDVLKVFGGDYNTHDGTAVRDYINVNDLAIAHIKALDIIGNKPYDIFNVGTGSGYSVLDIIKSFENQGVKIPYKIVGRRSGDIEKIFADITKAKEVLDWEPQYSLDDTVRSLIKMIKKN